MLKINHAIDNLQLFIGIHDVWIWKSRKKGIVFKQLSLAHWVAEVASWKKLFVSGSSILMLNLPERNL